MAISPIWKPLLLGLPTLGTRLPRCARNDNTDFEKALSGYASRGKCSESEGFDCEALAQRGNLDAVPAASAPKDSLASMRFPRCAHNDISQQA